MWIYTEPERLRHYPSRSSLKKAQERLVWHYESYSARRISPNTPWFSRTMPRFDGNLWYTGVSSNPQLSLAAHNVDLAQPQTFLCWVIPTRHALELKRQALTLDYFRHIWRDESDYLAPEQPYTYLYNFLAEENSRLLIDTSGFTPLKYVPARPAQIFAWRQDGAYLARQIDSQQQDDYPQLLEKLLEQARRERLTRLLLRHPWGKLMQCDLKPERYDLFFDNMTSQSGYVHQYLPPPYRENDWDLLGQILLDFLNRGAKQRGTKWKSVKKQLESPEIRNASGAMALE